MRTPFARMNARVINQVTDAQYGLHRSSAANYSNN